MIFQHTHNWIVGRSPNTKLPKTQTRRIVKAGDELMFYDGDYYVCRLNKKGEFYNPYITGKVLAVQPARNKSAIWIGKYTNLPFDDPLAWLTMQMVSDFEKMDSRAKRILREHGHKELRIRITRIRQEDVREISNEDVRAEGYSHVRDFLHTWIAMHDKTLAHDTWGEKKLMTRPARLYKAWVLDFEKVIA